MNDAATFANVGSPADICAVLGRSNPGDVCGAATAQFMVLELNLCRSRLCPSLAIDSACGGNTTVSQSLAEADGILSNPGRTPAQCATAKCESQELNTGIALQMDSLRMSTAAGGGITLAWQKPLWVDPSDPVTTYHVWRRIVGENGYSQIGSVGGNTTTFTDLNAGGFSYEYEVTAAQ